MFLVLVLNDFITENIKEAASISIPRFVARSNNSLPSEIIEIINQKRVVRKEFRKTRHPSLKILLNKLSDQVKSEIRKYKADRWVNFLGSLGPYPVSSHLFWIKINQAKNSKKTVTYPTLNYKNQL